MGNWQARTQMLIGEDGVGSLAGKKIAVFGVGGVGGFACEALARAGIGAIDIFDDDIVSETNLNRQLVALQSTIGMPKAQVMCQRIKDINPACVATPHQVFYLPENAQNYPLDKYDYVVDAVDTVSAKLALIQQAKLAGVPIICSMGAGNKLRPELFCVADIEKTTVCPLARVLRQKLKKLRIKKVKVVFSTEVPVKLPPATTAGGLAQNTSQLRKGSPKTNSPGSISFVPAAAGLVLAGQVVRDLLVG